MSVVTKVISLSGSCNVTRYRLTRFRLATDFQCGDQQIYTEGNASAEKGLI